jgi:hypothetical protein
MRNADKRLRQRQYGALIGRRPPILLAWITILHSWIGKSGHRGSFVPIRFGE